MPKKSTIIMAAAAFVVGVAVGIVTRPSPDPPPIHGADVRIPESEYLARSAVHGNDYHLKRMAEQYGPDSQTWPLPMQLIRVQRLIQNEKIREAYPQISP